MVEVELSKAEKVNRVLKGIEGIENAIRPYEYYSEEVTKALNFLATMKDSLRDPEKADLDYVLERLTEMESQAIQYRGYEPADEALRCLHEIRKILGKG